MEKVRKDSLACFVEQEVSELSNVLLSIPDDRTNIAGEREHATALFMACRHLPPQLLYQVLVSLPRRCTFGW